MAYEPRLDDVAWEEVVETEVVAEPAEPSQRTQKSQVPFGLEVQDVAMLDDLVTKFPHLKQSALQLTGSSLADSTMKNYEGAVSKFQEFTNKHKITYKSGM